MAIGFDWNSRAPRRSGLAVLAACASLALAACGSTKVDSNKQPVTTPPVSVSVSPSNATLAVGGQTLSFSAAVANSSNTAVTWQVNGVSGGNATVGTISASGQYLSPAALPSPASVTVSATSEADSTAEASVTLTLVAASAAVTVSVSPATATVKVGSGSQAFLATVSNAANLAVTWQVNGITGGDATVGTISASGVYQAPATMPAQPNITITAISVADKTKSATAAVTLSPLSPPTIGGSPATTVTAGTAYDFKPTASDPNGLPLTFSITGKPSWATFSTTTGELSGTPGSGDIGTSTITITASNGTTQASMSFVLSVVQAATGSATLSWVAPTTHTDGSAMTDLAGFRVYYGMQQGSLSNRLSIANATVTTTIISSLTSGTWYFAVTAVDSAGHESGYSNIASKTL